MKINKQAAIDHINSVLSRHQTIDAVASVSPLRQADNEAELDVLYRAAIERLCPIGSVYRNHLSNVVEEEGYVRFDIFKGTLRALLADYQNDRLQTFEQCMRQELFGDFLEMARYLLNDEKLKDPAAVLAGGVLEQHLRKLCQVNGILPIPPKLDAVNSELAKNGVYAKLMQKQITAWAGLRNHAAHAEYDQYTAEQVQLMIDGIQHFMASYPA